LLTPLAGVQLSLGQITGSTTDYFDGALFNATTEYFNQTMFVGAAMIIVSVGMVIRTESRSAQPTGALEASPAASEEVIEEEQLEAAEAASVDEELAAEASHPA